MKRNKQILNRHDLAIKNDQKNIDYNTKSIEAKRSITSKVFHSEHSTSNPYLASIEHSMPSVNASKSFKLRSLKNEQSKRSLDLYQQSNISKFEQKRYSEGQQRLNGLQGLESKGHSEVRTSMAPQSDEYTTRMFSLAELKEERQRVRSFSPADTVLDHSVKFKSSQLRAKDDRIAKVVYDYQMQAWNKSQKHSLINMLSNYSHAPSNSYQITLRSPNTDIYSQKDKERFKQIKSHSKLQNSDSLSQMTDFPIKSLKSSSSYKRSQISIRVPDKSYIIKEGKIKSTASYISESPFTPAKPRRKITQKQITIYETSDDSENDTIHEIKQRNIDLRKQLETKVQIFEQYVKVAQLQNEKNILQRQENRASIASARLTTAKLVNPQITEHAHTYNIQLMNQNQELWQLLETKQNSHAVQIEDLIIQKQKELQVLTYENAYEIEILRQHQGFIQPKKVYVKSKQEVDLEWLIKQQIARRDELSQWGFNSYVISYTIKVRTMEDLVDKAQRLKIKPSQDLADEVARLKKLRDQTYEDLHQFVAEREKKHWRSWDKFKHVKGKEAAVPQVDKAQIWWQGVEKDFQAISAVNIDMTEFINRVKGKGWLMLFAMSKRRKNQTLPGVRKDLKQTTEEINPTAAAVSVEEVVQPAVDLMESKWLKALTLEKQRKDMQAKDSRVARLATLFDSDEEQEQRLDQLAAKDNMANFLKKVDHHLTAEKALITNWQNQ